MPIKAIAYICLIFCFEAIAGSSDLYIELDFNEENGIVFEPSGEFTLTVTNLGPDIAAEGVPLLRPISIFTSVIQDNGSFTPEIQISPGAQGDNSNCSFLFIIGEPLPGESVTYAYSIDVPSLSVNETVQCFGSFSRHFQNGSREIEWSIFNEFDTDPNPKNNNQVITFGIPARPVPMNSWFTLVLMGLLILVFGVKTKRLN